MADLSGSSRPQRIVVELRPISRVLVRLIVLILIVSLAINYWMYQSLQKQAQPLDGLKEQYHSLTREGQDKIAVIKVKGLIMAGDAYVKKQIERVRKDQNVKGVVLRVDSPGGTVSGSDEIYRQLKKLKEERKIPIVVSMGGVAASGGYYVSMAVGDEAKSIFAEPSTITGSIGVIIPHYSVADLMKRLDVADDSIVSHPLKRMGTPTKLMTEEDRAIFQSMVDEMFGNFKEIVKAGRPAFREDPASLDQVATGRVFTAQQAKGAKLIDEVGLLEDAIARAVELAKLDAAKTQAVQYQSPEDLFDLIFGAVESRQNGTEIAQVLDMLSTPRAYYLYGDIPQWRQELILAVAKQRLGDQ